MANVNILMATYNGGRYIGQQIESIIAQWYGDWRLVIHDDGSTDDTVETVKQYCATDSRITFIEDDFSAKDAGQHFMYMLRFADAPFVCFCDQDDVWKPNKLEVMLNAIESRDNKIPQVVFSDASLYYDQTNVIDGKLLFTRPTKLREILFTNGGIHGSASMFNAKMRDAMMVRHDFVSMHDHVLTLIGCSFGEVCYLDEKLFLYRQHANNVTGNMNVTAIARLKKAFGCDENKFTLSTDTIKGVEAFLIEYRQVLNVQDIALVENYLALPHYSWIRRFCSIVSNGYSLNNSRVQLWIKVLTRKFVRTEK